MSAYVAAAETACVTARAYGFDSSMRRRALLMREVAISSMALVTFCIVWADLMRARYSRSCAPMVLL
jgi:hypothetical protein